MEISCLLKGSKNEISCPLHIGILSNFSDDSFVFMQGHYFNLKATRFVSASFNRFLANKSHCVSRNAFIKRPPSHKRPYIKA